MQAWNCSCKCYRHDIAFYKEKEETLQTYNRKNTPDDTEVKWREYFLALLGHKDNCSGSQKYIILSSKVQFQH